LKDSRQWDENLKLASKPPVSESTYGKLARGAILLNAGRIEEGTLPLADAMERLGARPGRQNLLINAGRAAGRDANALDRARKTFALRPLDYSLRALLLDLTAIWAEPEETLAIIEDSGRRPSYSTAWFEAYRRFALWRKEGGDAAKVAAIDAIKSAAKAGMPPDSAAPLLVRLGDLDAAFAIADAFADPRTLEFGPPYPAYFLYLTDTAPMRRDTRFIALADKLGLLAFWRKTGTWPDFCRREPDSICLQMQTL
jgi:hypothetical protein